MGISQVKRKAIFLDRDGVLNNVIIINGKPYPPRSVTELAIPNDALSALTMLKSAGFLLIGATNQPDVSRGTTSRAVVEAINAQLMTQLPLDEIRVCYHDDADQCFCRKPLPGLLLQAAEQHQIDLGQSFMVGDRWKDIEAGQQAGCKTSWIRQSYQEKIPVTSDFTASSLTLVARWILGGVF